MCFKGLKYIYCQRTAPYVLLEELVLRYIELAPSPERTSTANGQVAGWDPEGTAQASTDGLQYSAVPENKPRTKQLSALKSSLF